MLTRCPQCETIFRVSKKHISAAKGLVRCGSCKDIFNAKEHVIKSKKDLKKPAVETKPETQVTAKPMETRNVSTKPVVKKEPDSFDFINDGFTSTGDFKKFNSAQPVKKPPQKKKPISKAEALERGKSNSINFDSVFKEETPKISTEDSFIISKPSVQKNDNVSKADKKNPATFESKKTQPHKSTVVKPRTDKKSNKPGNFISQNVIDIKNAFSSISKKISSKVANKVQPEKQSDEIVKKSLENKLNKSNISNQVTPAVVETNIARPATAKHKKPKKPAVMSIDSQTDIYSSSKNNALKKSTQTTDNKLESIPANTKVNKTEQTTQKASAPKIKSTPKLKEDAALKLAIQLKKAAQDKSKSNSDKKSKVVIEKPEQASKPELNIVDIKSPKKSTDEKAVQIQEQKSKKNETTENRKVTDSAVSTPKESTLISKEETDLDENFDDDTVHIHMQTMDIPMVLRESLEELDLPTRSIEMTAFMVISLISLCLGLLLQFTVFRSIEVQQSYPTLKPLITRICKTFTCDYSGPRDIKKIQLISRDIRVHPTTKGALLISATIVNNAGYQQPYPNFSVKLSSLSGKTVARRFFSPNDYLGNLSNKLLLMPPKQPIRIALEVVDPGKEAINFEFKFLSRK